MAGICMESLGVQEHTHQRAQNLSCRDVSNGSPFPSPFENLIPAMDYSTALPIGTDLKIISKMRLDQSIALIVVQMTWLALLSGLLHQHKSRARKRMLASPFIHHTFVSTMAPATALATRIAQLIDLRAWCMDIRKQIFNSL